MTGSSPSATRQWSPSRGAAFAVGNLEALNGGGELEELFERFTAEPEPAAV